MKDYRIGFHMYTMIKEEKDSEGPWKNFMTYVEDDNVNVIVVLAGRDHLRIEFDPDAPDQIREVPVQ